MTLIDTQDEYQINKGCLIGICGNQASGKTVFLTCVYKTLSRSSEFELDSEKGGAEYFETIEKEIRDTGKTEPSAYTKSARLLFKLREHIEKLGKNYLPVNLFDFKGGNFPLIADSSGESVSSLPDEEKEQLKKINRKIELCDGIIILINSILFQKDSVIVEKEIPFINSITKLIEDCHNNKRPIALVFSQRDQNPSLTEDCIQNFETVQNFQKQFVSDLQDAKEEEKSYGIVKLITCYEIDGATGRPKKQDEEGNFWLQEAADVFKSIFEASLPNAIQRIKKEKDDAKRAQKAKLEKDKTKAEKDKNKRLQRIFLTFGCILLLLFTTPFGFMLKSHFQHERDKQFVKDLALKLNPDLIEQITKNEQKKLAAIEPKKHITQTLNFFWADFQKQLKSAIESEQAYVENYLPLFDKYKSFEASMLDPTPEWWTNELQPALNTRIDFIKSLSSINQAIKSKNKVDKRFWEIKSQLEKNKFLNNPKYSLIVKRKFVTQAIKAILELDENEPTLKIFKSIMPELKNHRMGTKLSFKKIYLALLKHNNLTEYNSLRLELDNDNIGFKSLNKKLKERAYVVSSVLNQIIKTRSVSDRKRILSNLIKTLEKEYLFEIHDTEWPTGTYPLTKYLRKSIDNPKQFISRISDNSIYQIELDSILALINSQYYLYQTISTFKKIEKKIEDINRYSSYDRTIDLSGLDSLEDEINTLAPQPEDYLKETKKFFEKQKEYLSYMRGLIEKWNESLDESSDSENLDHDRGERLRKKVHKFITDRCIQTKSLKKGDCADVL